MVADETRVEALGLEVISDEGVQKPAGWCAGSAHSLPTLSTVALGKALHSSLLGGRDLDVGAFSESAIMLKRLNGRVKSISTGDSSGPLAWILATIHARA